MAASVAVGVLTVAGFWVSRNHLPTTYSTQSGERSAFRLGDGSQVILNSATRLDVKLGSSRREFTLRRGEAVFTVAEDPTRPFIVSAGDSEVTALGTRFQVRNETGAVVVTLLEGRIAVEREGQAQPLQLQPNEQVKFNVASHQMVRRTVDTEVASSWTIGRLRFKHTPVTDVLEEVNRYSKIQIHLADSTLRTLPVNATFDIGDSASVVSALEKLLGVEVSSQSPTEIVLARHTD